MIIENNFGEKDNDFYGVKKICICSCIWSDVPCLQKKKKGSIYANLYLLFLHNAKKSFSLT
jgi:hypothetical protein